MTTAGGLDRSKDMAARTLSEAESEFYIGDLLLHTNRLPEAAPYVVAEAQVLPPPYHDHWEQEDSPGQCQTCHQKIFDEWNGSMMSNSWRDPAWRAAFLLLARSTSANGECDTPEPPDGNELPGSARVAPFPRLACRAGFRMLLFGCRHECVS